MKKQIVSLIPNAIEAAMQVLELKEIKSIEKLSIVLNLAFLLISRDLNLSFNYFNINERDSLTTGEVSINNATFIAGMADQERNYYLLDREIKPFIYQHLKGKIYILRFPDGTEYLESCLHFNDLPETIINTLSVHAFLNIKSDGDISSIKSIFDIDNKLINRRNEIPKNEIFTLF